MPGMKLYIGVWIGAVAATLLEVAVRLLGGESSLIVWVISLLAAAQAIAVSLYYQNLRYEGIRLATLPLAAIVGITFLTVAAITAGMNML